MNSSVDITILPGEVRQYIWSYCDKRSLKVLSVCCKQMYTEVKPFVWKRVEVSWQALDGITKELVKKPHPNLKFISCLVLGAPSASSDRNLSLGYLTYGFGSFLERCDRLKSLTISRFLAADGPRLVSEVLPQLENLEMTDMKFGAGDLKPLVGLHQLKSLTLRACLIQEIDWEVIWQLESLEHLTMTKEDLPPDYDDWFPHGGFSLKNLLSLKYFYSAESCELYSCIAKTCMKLESLDLIGSDIQDSDMLNLCSLPCLKSLSLTKAHQITDLGISYLSNISCLERLQVGFCVSLSPCCLEHIAKIETLRILDLYEFSDDSTDISCLSKLVNLHTLVISAMRGLTDSALRTVAQFKSLRKLDIADNDNFTEEGIRHLAQLPHLKTLELDSMNVSVAVLMKHGLLDKVPEDVERYWYRYHTLN